MDDLKSLFEAIKEFIWDVVGYFLPGFYLLILLSVIVDKAYFINTPLVDGKSGTTNFILLVVAYILGYVIYGVGEYLEERRKKKNKSSQINIQEEIASTENYRLAAELLQKKIDPSQVTTRINQLRMKEVRNLAMSYTPEADKKVYTFMFRSDLSRHIANISFPVGSLALIIWVAQLFTPIKIVHAGVNYALLYIVLIVSYYALRYTRDRFYKIAMSIPFSLFISKITHE